MCEIIDQINKIRKEFETLAQRVCKPGRGACKSGVCWSLLREWSDWGSVSEHLAAMERLDSRLKDQRERKHPEATVRDLAKEFEHQSKDCSTWIRKEEGGAARMARFNGYDSMYKQES